MELPVKNMKGYNFRSIVQNIFILNAYYIITTVKTLTQDGVPIKFGMP